MELHDPCAFEHQKIFRHGQRPAHALFEGRHALTHKSPLHLAIRSHPRSTHRERIADLKIGTLAEALLSSRTATEFHAYGRGGIPSRARGSLRCVNATPLLEAP